MARDPIFVVHSLWGVLTGWRWFRPARIPISWQCVRKTCASCGMAMRPASLPGARTATEALEDGADLAVVTDCRAVLAKILSGNMRLPDAGTVFPGLQPQSLGLWG
jgi:hypothetical protein